MFTNLKIYRRAPGALFRTLSAIFVSVLACCNAACANPGVGANLGLKSSVHSESRGGAFAVPERLRPRVDFWKDIFTRFGGGHSVIHHRDFPQIVFGVIDLSREYQSMSKTAFEVYKSDVVKRTVDDVKNQLLELADGGDARTSFQERALEQISERKLPREVLRVWVEQDLIRTQTGIRERYAEAVRRAWRYLPIMEQIFVQEFGLPRELTRLPFIESSFDYTAYSSVGAAGIWQFMPRTARAHRMLVGRYVDERRDPLRATRAAAEYLRSAYQSLGSWPLAVTSYNHGVGGVRSKVRKAGTEDLARIIEDPNDRYFGFASTNFYPEFLAAVEIFEDHQRYFPEVKEEPPLRVVSYPLRRPVSASVVTARLGIPTEDLREANYGLLDPVWAGRASIPSGYTLKVPIGFKERADRVLGSEATDIPVETDSVPPTSRVVPVANMSQQSIYKVKRGETIDSIARKFGLAPTDLMRANGLSSSKVSSGQQLRISRYSRAPQTPSRPAPKSSAVRYVVVRPGDTLATIAQKRGVSIERLKAANGLRGNTIVAGQKLKLP
ncbi:MAG: LysM peptidoglycan-binding domain-containing protein [Pseudomonadota bacterium]|jgi:membrane-bound lytic murein transglycosylase D